MKAYFEECSMACGLGILGEFGESPYHDEIGSLVVQGGYNGAGGTGYCVAAFIKNANCKKAYEEIKSLYPIVYQSEVRKNLNSGNQFFFIIFDYAK